MVNKNFSIMNLTARYLRLYYKRSSQFNMGFIAQSMP